MLFNVTSINFTFDDDTTEEEKDAAISLSLGTNPADDEDDLFDMLCNFTGFMVSDIQYEIVEI